MKLEQALKLMPSSEEIMYNLALVDFELKKYQQAWELVNRMKETDCQELIAALKREGSL